jgi:hypothetical protein
MKVKREKKDAVGEQIKMERRRKWRDRKKEKKYTVGWKERHKSEHSMNKTMTKC